jgi:N utilization substance protein A
LTGWEINIMTDQEAVEKAESESVEVRDMLMKQLDVDEDVAAILVQEGFTSLEEVAYVPKPELMEIEEFDEDLVDELRRRAEDALVTRAIVQEEALKLAAPEQDLVEMDGMDDDTARLLASHGIKSMEDLADCAVDELLEIPGFEKARAEELIMTARAPWFAEAENEPAG